MPNMYAEPNKPAHPEKPTSILKQPARHTQYPAPQMSVEQVQEDRNQRNAQALIDQRRALARPPSPPPLHMRQYAAEDWEKVNAVSEHPAAYDPWGGENAAFEEAGVPKIRGGVPLGVGIPPALLQGPPRPPSPPPLHMSQMGSHGVGMFDAVQDMFSASGRQGKAHDNYIQNHIQLSTEASSSFRNRLHFAEEPRLGNSNFGNSESMRSAAGLPPRPPSPP